MCASRIGRRHVLRTLGAAGLVGLAGCSSGGNGDNGGGNDGGTTTGGGGGGGSGTTTGTTGGASGGKSSVKAAWVYLNEVGDLGWSWAHDQGRKAVDDRFDWLETTYTAAVAPADSKRVFEQYASKGYDVVFGTSFDYMDPMFQIAKKYPDVRFEHCSGYKTRENMGRYFGRMYQARYLLGVAAGMVTDANKVGYVAAFPIPEVVRLVDAMALGARSVNADVTFEVRWLNTWFDPAKSKQAADSLMDANCDVITSGLDSPAAVKAAHQRGVWAGGYDAPMGKFGAKNYLSSPIWHWKQYYAPTLQAVRDGTWKADFYWKGLDAGVVDLDDWGPNVPKEVQNEVADVRSGIVSGDVDVWADSKFEGKSDEFFFQKISSYVDGIQGNVPS